MKTKSIRFEVALFRFFPPSMTSKATFVLCGGRFSAPRARARACQRARLRRGPSDFFCAILKEGEKGFFFSFRALRPKRDQADSNSGK